MQDTILSKEFSSSPDLIEKLYRYGMTKNYHEGDIILDENASIRSIPIVMKGMLKVIRTEEDGREILLYYIKQGKAVLCLFWGECIMKKVL